MAKLRNILLSFSLIFCILSAKEVFSTDLYLDYGDCYFINENTSVCSQECEALVQNFTYNHTYQLNCTEYNFTCPEYNFTDHFNKIDSHLIDIRNISNVIKDDMDTFNYTKQYSEANSNYLVCITELSECRNETEELKGNQEMFRQCSNEVLQCTSSLTIRNTEIENIRSTRTFWFLGCGFAGLALGYFLWHKSPPEGMGPRANRPDSSNIKRTGIQKLKEKFKGGN